MKRTPELQALWNKAVDHHKKDEHAQAYEVYRSYLVRLPQDFQAWANLGVLLRKLGRYDASIAAQERALELSPQHHTIRNNLINALVSQGEYDEALRQCALILKDKPTDPEAFRLRLVALRCQGHHHQVIEELHAWEEKHGYVEKNRIQTALCRLTLGDYLNGFNDFEARFAGGEVSLPANAPWPRWRGEPLEGKRIIVLPEQGMGDMLTMARFLPQLKSLGCEVHLLAKPPLLRLLENAEGMDRLRGSVELSEPFDFYTSIVGLPYCLGFEGPPPPPVKLTIPDDSRARARKLVAPFADRFKIGVVWTGSLTYPSNHKRSCSPTDFVGISRMPGVQLFSLYKGGAHQEFIQSGMAGLIVDACGEDRDLADAAAVIEAMDLLITSDTGVVHVAGALGKENWNMLSAEGFWLYGLGDRTPWYPSMKIYRKVLDGDWRPIFARIEADLAKRLAGQKRKKAKHG